MTGLEWSPFVWTTWEIPLAASPTRILLYLFLSLFLVNTVHRIRRWYRLRHIPGPWICGWTSLRLLRSHMGPRIDRDWKELVDKYGPIVRMAPNDIICADVDELIRIQSPRSLYRKDDWYQIGQINPPHHNLLSMQDKEARRERKRKITPGYSGRGGDDFEQGINKSIASWVDLIERKYISGSAGGGEFRPLDLAIQAHYYSLDSLGEIAYSTQLGFLENDSDMHKIIETNEHLMPVFFAMSNFVWLGKYLRRWPLVYLLPRDGDKSGFGAIMGFTSTIVDRRLAELSSLENKGIKPKGDILQAFINEGLNYQELKEEVTIQFFVGSDTVASLLRMTFLCLLTNPASYRALQSEIDAADSQGLLSSPIIRNSESRDHLPYLQAVIRESLRFWPPVACGVFYKTVPPGGDTLSGFYLPEGTKVSTVAGMLAMNRDQKLWGDDSECFRPERWLDADLEEERLRQMTKVVDINFAAGQFLCAGKGIALMQVNKVVPELLRRYDFSLVDPAEPIKIRGAIAWLAHDFWVRVERRERK